MATFCYDPTLDLNDRDPNDLVSHIRVKFSDVIAEPDEHRSCDCVWDASGCMYECCFLMVYHISAFFCGCWLACFYGIVSAHTGFSHVWYFTPFIKCLELVLWPFKCIWSLCVKCVISPWCEACGYVFWAFEDNPNPNMQWSC